MSIEMIASLIAVLVGLTALIAFYDSKIKDAEKMGALKQRVEQMEKDNCKAETTKDKLDALILAVGQLTQQVRGLEKRFDDREQRDRED